MTRIKISNERFQELLNNIVAEIQQTLINSDYRIEFNDEGDTAYITQSDNFPFYLTYLETFSAVMTLYDCSMWFDVRNNKPCLVFINE
jgi:CRISPR type II-A-associated protein Csn2